MNFLHTLSFNLPSETEEATRSLYELNPENNFKHVIVDLGFPLEYGADIPENIEEAKFRNSIKLMKIAKQYGSDYLKLPNIGVSQNWNQVLNHIKYTYGFTEKDCLISCEPDERPLTHNWVEAISDALKNKRMAAAGLIMPDQKEYIQKNMGNITKAEINGRKVFIVNGTLSVCQVGFSGKYLMANDGVPVPEGHAVYGYLESAFAKSLRKLNMGWCLLEDFECLHTECSTLYRSWKNSVTSGEFTGLKQISFEQWILLQKS